MKSANALETKYLRRDLISYHADKDEYFRLMHLLEGAAIILVGGAVVLGHFNTFAFGTSLLAVSVVFHLLGKIGLDKEKYALGRELNEQCDSEENLHKFSL